jgi:hypothetical protein
MGFFHTAVAFFLKELRLQRFGKVFFTIFHLKTVCYGCAYFLVCYLAVHVLLFLKFTCIFTFQKIEV